MSKYDMQWLPKDKHFRKCMEMFNAAGGKVAYDFSEFKPVLPDLAVPGILYPADYERWKKDCRLAATVACHQRQLELVDALDKSGKSLLVIY